MTVDAQILKALRDNGSGISGAELSQKLSVGRAAISRRIDELRSLGYDIEASPHRGYRLLSGPDVLHADELFSRLGKIKTIGRDIQVFEETTSTNDVVEKFAREGLKEGIVVFAESQTKGRGRLGRRWVSPLKKGLWFSVLLRPKLKTNEVTQLTVASATALRRAIEAQTGLFPEVKWPNDICFRGRKVAGILTELNAKADRVKYVVLGIGIDVNLSQSDFPPELRQSATSLKIESGKTVSRPKLAVRILRELDEDYERLCAGQFASIADEWEKNCATLGQNVLIRTGGRKIQGRAESLDENGALLVRNEHGRLERVLGGDVTLDS